MGQLPAFEELVTMADEDPEAFNEFRQQACQQYILSAPNRHQHRLMAVQNRIEMTLDRAKTPMAGLISISGMMHDSLCLLTDKLLEFKLYAENKPVPIKPVQQAEIVDLTLWRAQQPSQKH